MNNTRPLRVFLCHASQDKPTVRELNNRLKAEEWLDPWLDEEKLSLGQHWTTVIEDALSAADIVIIFLSKNSVKKEGFVQRELTYALEISLEKPSGVTFLIPFRLDDCEVPRSLRARQWGDYFGDKKENTYTALLRSLKEKHDYIGEENRKNYDEQIDKQILQNPSQNPLNESIVLSGKKGGTLPDFRVHQRDYLLEISRSITQELDLDKLPPMVVRIATEMLAGQAGMILLKEADNWRVANANGVSTAFFNHLILLLAEKEIQKLNVSDLNHMLKELTYTVSNGLLNGTGLPLVTGEQIIGIIFIFRNYPDLFTPNDRELVQAFSDQTAIAIRNALRFKEVTKKD